MLKIIKRWLKRNRALRELRRAKRAVMRHVKNEEDNSFEDFRTYARLMLDVQIAESKVREFGGAV